MLFSVCFAQLNTYNIFNLWVRGKQNTDKKFLHAIWNEYKEDVSPGTTAEEISNGLHMVILLAGTCNGQMYSIWEIIFKKLGVEVGNQVNYKEAPRITDICTM